MWSRCGRRDMDVTNGMSRIRTSVWRVGTCGLPRGSGIPVGRPVELTGQLP
ncbi:hypothetical protein Bbelb_257280, partial [Branchiostoma belcheri]